VNQALEAEVGFDINEQTFNEIKKILRLMIPELEVSEEEPL